MTAPVCWVDCETTGLDPERHEIWEVGLILPDGSEHLWQLPVDLSRADPIALNIGRYHDRRALAVRTGADNGDVTLRVDQLRFARIFADVTRGLHLAGAVVSFDEKRLERLLRANGECPMWHFRLICVETLVAGKTGVLPDGLKNAAERLGVPVDEASLHTALGDARLAKAVYEACMGDQARVNLQAEAKPAPPSKG